MKNALLTKFIDNLHMEGVFRSILKLDTHIAPKVIQGVPHLESMNALVTLLFEELQST